jgi:DNA-binding NarL/FixJ family response regulator
MTKGNLTRGNLQGSSGNNHSLKTYVAHRSPAVLERLTDMLVKIPALEIVGQTSNAAGTLESIRQLGPEVLIIDAYLLGRKGLEVLKVIGAQKPAAVVIILADLNYPQYRSRFYSAGAEIVLDISNEFIRLDEFLRELASPHC